jgi:hypothetical protein
MAEKREIDRKRVLAAIARWLVLLLPGGPDEMRQEWPKWLGEIIARVKHRLGMTNDGVSVLVPLFLDCERLWQTEVELHLLVQEACGQAVRPWPEHTLVDRVSAEVWEGAKSEAQRGKDAKLLSDLLGVLSEHCGERGDNEGAVETLRRVIAERDAKGTMGRQEPDPSQAPAIWFELFKSALGNTATTWVGEDTEEKYAAPNRPPAIVQRAAALATEGVPLALQRGVKLGHPVGRSKSYSIEINLKEKDSAKIVQSFTDDLERLVMGGKEPGSLDGGDGGPPSKPPQR